jgi:hypothetical protein
MNQQLLVLVKVLYQARSSVKNKRRICRGKECPLIATDLTSPVYECRDNNA